MKTPSILQKSLNNIRGIFDKENIEEKLKELEKITSNKNFWKDKNLVKKTVKAKKFFEDILNSYNRLNNELENIKDLFDLATQEKDEDTLHDCIKKISNILLEIKKIETSCFYLEKMMIMTFISKYTQVQVVRKVKIGQICLEECT